LNAAIGRYCERDPRCSFRELVEILLGLVMSDVVARAMSRLTETDLRGAEIAGADLRDAWLRDVNLSGAPIRGGRLTAAEIDGQIDGLTIHGIEVVPLVEAELDRRHPERAALRADDADTFRSGWAGLEMMWAATIERVAAMSAGTIDVSVDREWSFAQTLRHLVFATDVWLGDAILHCEQPYHRYGEPFSGWRDRASEVGIELDAHPSSQDVLEMRADRVRMVRDYLRSLTDDRLAEDGHRPFFVSHSFTVRDCLRIIINEEWHHHRYGGTGSGCDLGARFRAPVLSGPAGPITPPSCSML
jgi:DinB superfamily/Pentapeptide repeats (8 copies)